MGISQFIKDKAMELGFSACGIAEVAKAGSEEAYFDQWIAEGYHAGMKYMENHREIRLNPDGLVEGAKSVISVALNYYPKVLRNPAEPYISYYAYGEDYHEVIKGKAPKNAPTYQAPEKITDKETWACQICGYIYEGDLTKEPEDFVCPICKQPKSMFKKQ